MTDSKELQFQVVNIGVRTVTIELETDTPYEREKEYQVCVDGKSVLSTKQNVTTIHGLKPDTEYTISLKEKDEEAAESSGVVKQIHTKYESILLNVKEGVL